MELNSLLERIPAVCMEKATIQPGTKLKMTFASQNGSLIDKDFLEMANITAGSIIGIFSKNSPKGIDDIAIGDKGTAAQINEIVFNGSPHLFCSIVVTGFCNVKCANVSQSKPLCFIKAVVTNIVSPDLNLLIQAFLSNLPKNFSNSLMNIPQKDILKVLKSTSNILSTSDWRIHIFKKIVEQILNQAEVNEADDNANNGADSSNTKKQNAKSHSSMSSDRKVLKRGKHAGVGLFENDDENDMAELENKIINSGMPEYARKVANRELKRLKKTPAHFPDHAPLRHYLEWITTLPWVHETEDHLDIEKARLDLDADHFGLDALKKRVIEYLAVKKLKNSLKGPILCFVGPPGVGKTSVGKSIANTLGRKFQRISLGGTCDQSDIRGHRRTYVGSMPGRILNALKNASSKNPVILLDEIDKLGNGFHGDPSAALLEVLDPEQNHTFTDHYLNMPFDLSQVLFIATANSTSTIPAPLLDRMEVINIPGYTVQEKTTIATRHLIPKQIQENGLTLNQISISDETAQSIITRYTREAGVRSLERRLGAVCRNVAVKLVSNDSAATTTQCVVQPCDLEEILGIRTYESEVAQRVSIPGVATGLAWTSAGGEIMFVEATKMGGDRKISYTGQLGDVMKESAQLALSWIRSHAVSLGLSETSNEDMLDHCDIHIHFPAGAVGKDGPSAGIAIVTTLVSLFSEKTVRSDTAMTGEITLRGLVLPVGGIKDKILAAHRADIKRVILPKRNEKDLKELPKEVKNDMTFILVERIEEVLAESFDDKLELIKLLPITSKL